MNTNNITSLKQHCEQHGFDYTSARRHARKGNLPGAQKILGTWAIAADADPAATQDALATSATRTRNTRDDGRRLFKVYLTDEERATVIEMLGEGSEKLIIDLREQRRERKAARAQVQTDDERDAAAELAPGAMVDAMATKANEAYE